MRAVYLIFLFLVPFILHAQQKLLPVKKDRLWGYIDTSGRVMIQPQFDHADDFTGNFAVVKHNKRYALINRTGKLLTPSQFDEVQVLNDSLAAVVTDSLWGVIDHNGNTVLPMECEWIAPAGKHIFLYSSSGKTGAMASSGKLVVPAQYDTIILAHKRFLFASLKGSFALYNFAGKEIISPGKDTIAIHNDSIAMYKVDSLWGCMHVSGKTFFTPQWKDYDFVSKTLVRVAGDSAWALFSLRWGTLICPPIYTDFFPYSEDHIIATSKNLYGLIDMNGNEKIPLIYDDIAYIGDEVLKMQKGRLWGLANVSGKVLREPLYTYIGDFKDNLARSWIGPKIGAINIHGQEIAKAENDSLWLHSTVIKIFKTKGSEARIVTVDDNGYVIDDNTFANLKTISIGYAPPPRNGNINRAQTQLDSLLVNDFKWFYDRKLKKWGMANIKSQDTIIHPCFTQITILWNEGMTLVEKPMNKYLRLNFYGIEIEFSNTYGLIDNTTGKYLLKPDYLELRPSDAHGVTNPYIRCINGYGRRGVVSLDGREDFTQAVYVEGFRCGRARVYLTGKVTITTASDRNAAAPLDSLIGNLNCKYRVIQGWRYPRNAWFKGDEPGNHSGYWIYVKRYEDVGPQKTSYYIAYPFYHNSAIVKSYGKWGVVDTAFRTSVQAKFDYIDHLPNSDRKLYRMQTTVNKTGYVDKNGNEVLPASVDAGLDFKEGMAAVRSKGKWGFIDSTGRMIVEPQYEEARSFSEGYAAVKLKGKWGFIDRSGSVAVENKYQQVGDFHEGMAWVRLKGKNGYVNDNGALVIQAVYSRASDFNNGLAPVRDGDKWGVMDKEGQWIAEPKFEALSNYDDEGFAVARRRNKSGLINARGEVKGKFRYDAIKPFSEGLAPVRTRKGWGYIDTTGKLVIEAKFGSAEKFENGIALVRDKGKYGYINATGEFAIAPGFLKARPHSEGLAYARMKKEAGFIDETGRFKLATKRQCISGFSDGYALVSDTGRSYTFIDKNGKRITRKRFELAKAFQDSVAHVRYKGKWGAIDTRGLVMVPYKYAEIGSFSEGIAKFRINVAYGVYSSFGSEIIAPDCDNIVFVNEKLYRVEKGDKIGYFDPGSRTWKWELAR